MSQRGPPSACFARDPSVFQSQELELAPWVNGRPSSVSSTSADSYHAGEELLVP